MPRIGDSNPTSRLLQIHITLVNHPSDGNFLFASCISKLEDLCTNNVTLGMTMTVRDGLKLSSSLFFVLSTTHIDQCTAFFYSIIKLFMIIFMIVYPIDNVGHLFSVIWNVLSIISDIIPPIFPPGKDLSAFFCTFSYPLFLWHRHK